MVVLVEGHNWHVLLNSHWWLAAMCFLVTIYGRGCEIRCACVRWGENVLYLLSSVFFMFISMGVIKNLDGGIYNEMT